MVKKTYAAAGLLDYKMTLNVNGAFLRLCFSGGSMGYNGVISAKYSTDNPALQRMIENSEQFRSGRIYLFKEERRAETEIQRRNTTNKGK